MLGCCCLAMRGGGEARRGPGLVRCAAGAVGDRLHDAIRYDTPQVTDRSEPSDPESQLRV